MARIIVTKDDDRADACRAEILEDSVQGAYAQATCGEFIYDRGHFEDTAEATARHVDACDRLP